MGGEEFFHVLRTRGWLGGGGAWMLGFGAITISEPKLKPAEGVGSGGWGVVLGGPGAAP